MLRVGDVADLVRGTWPLVGDAVINDGQGLMLIVEKLPWANTLDVTRGVEAALGGARARPARASRSTPRSSARRPSSRSRSATSRRRIWFGAILMVLMLCLFLYEWRTALISVVAIPLSLIAAGLVLHWRGATINTMILAGMVIALGDIVDDAIIDIENVVRRLRQQRRGGQRHVDRQGHPRGVARGAERDRLRHADRDRGDRPGLHARRAVRIVLPSARHVLRARVARVDGRGAHGHAGDEPDLLPQPVVPASPGVAAGARAPARLPRSPGSRSSTGRAAPTRRSGSRR